MKRIQAAFWRAMAWHWEYGGTTAQGIVISLAVLAVLALELLATNAWLLWQVEGFQW